MGAAASTWLAALARCLDSQFAYSKGGIALRASLVAPARMNFPSLCCLIWLTGIATSCRPTPRNPPALMIAYETAFSGAAEAFGATGLMINTPNDVALVMKKAFDTAGPVIVGVHVDYRDNHQLFEMIRGDGIH